MALKFNTFISPIRSKPLPPFYAEGVEAQGISVFKQTHTADNSDTETTETEYQPSGCDHFAPGQGRGGGPAQTY